MPIYEYTCQECGKKFEKLMRAMGDQSKAPCPSCGSKKTERAMSVFAVSEGQSKSSPCMGCGGGPCPMG